MKLIKKILQRLSGYQYRQEYLCLANEKLPDPLHMYALQNEEVMLDITNLHLFVGYHPLVFAFPELEKLDLNKVSELNLVLSNHALVIGKHAKHYDTVARLTLRRFAFKQVAGSRIYLFEGTYGGHKFLSSFSQWAIQLENEWFNKKPGNVFLDANLYRQVQIAYAIPRSISLISVKGEEGFNLFPTDLNGDLDEKTYLISLRHAGMAARQVESAKRILLSRVDPGFYKNIYALGKNHMQPLKEHKEFPFSAQTSQNFGLPIPEQATGYYELDLEDSIDIGIHRVFIFSIFNNQANPELNSLKHIHNSYASWRKKQGLSGNYLLR